MLQFASVVSTERGGNHRLALLLALVGLGANGVLSGNASAEEVWQQTLGDSVWLELCPQDAASVTAHLDCQVMDFEPQVPPPQTASGVLPPRSEREDFILLDSCWVDADGCADFGFRFESLGDLGEWRILCNIITAYRHRCQPSGCLWNCPVDELFYLDSTEIYTVTVSNDAPTAEISVSPEPAWNVTVTLDPGASDPDGGPLEFWWQILERPAASLTELSDANAEQPTLAFTSDADLGWWEVGLSVDDDEGERREFTHAFKVPNVPPRVKIDGPTEIDAMETLELRLAPRDDPSAVDADGDPVDIDGGPLYFDWTVVSSPMRSGIDDGTPASRQADVSLATTGFDVGQWDFEVVVEDQEHFEPAVVTKSHSVTVNNLPPEIEWGGAELYAAGDEMCVSTEAVDDPDGGYLVFRWNIVQTPSAGSPGPTEGYGGNVSSLCIQTGEADAGTWIFELTVEDDEAVQLGDESGIVVDTRSILVDGPVHAVIDGPGTISTLDFPLELNGGKSWDSDSDCEMDPEQSCHTRLDGAEPDVSDGVVSWTWFVKEAPYGSLIPPGRVDELFDVAGTGPVLTLAAGDIETGEWTFELEVMDAEGNVDRASHAVEICKPEMEPVLLITGPRRYQLQSAGFLGRDAVVEAVAWDTDNLLDGESLERGLGIREYTWNITPPMGCDLDALPGTATDTYLIAPAGTLVPPACQGLWQVELTVEDDDSPSLSTTEETAVIFGDCPGLVCIDSPTASSPAVIEFDSKVEIAIEYHIEQALYDVTAFPPYAFGLFADVSIFHASDPTTPVYRALDASLFASSKASTPIFEWDGWGNDRLRPQSGFYSVRIDLLDLTLATPLASAYEADAIRLEVADIEILDSSTHFAKRDALLHGLPAIEIDYRITGDVSLADISAVVADESGSILYQTSLGPVAEDTWQWNGDTGGPDGPSILETGRYTVELVAFSATGELGSSEEHELWIYELEFLPVSNSLGGNPPEQFVAVNDDVRLGADYPDHEHPGPDPSEVHLEQLKLRFEPAGVPAFIYLSLRSGGEVVRFWRDSKKTHKLTLPMTWNLEHFTPPEDLYVEGLPGAGPVMEGGDAELVLVLERSPREPIEHREVLIHVSPVDLDLDTTMDGTVDFFDDGYETSAQALVVNVNNDDDDFAGIDCHDAIINGASDLDDLPELIVRRMRYMPPGGSVRLDVSDAQSSAWGNEAKEKLRLFTPFGDACIGPSLAYGGPDQHEYLVPPELITRSTLHYLIEAVDHGNVTIGLSVLDADGHVLGRDEVKVVLNVDRTPAGAPSRFGVRGAVEPGGAILEAIEGEIVTSFPGFNWSPHVRADSSTRAWLRLEDLGTPSGDYWVEIGLAIERQGRRPPEAKVYLDVGAGGVTVRSDEEPFGLPWPATVWLAIQVYDRGLVEARIEGRPWVDWNSPDFKHRRFSTYAIGADILQSVDQLPGDAGDPLRFFNLKVRTIDGWQDTELKDESFRIHDLDPDGYRLFLTESPEWAFKCVEPDQICGIWDQVVER